jgi:hypothetical protein
VIGLLSDLTADRNRYRRETVAAARRASRAVTTQLAPGIVSVASPRAANGVSLRTPGPVHAVAAGAAVCVLYNVGSMVNGRRRAAEASSRLGGVAAGAQAGPYGSRNPLKRRHDGSAASLGSRSPMTGRDPGLGIAVTIDGRPGTFSAGATQTPSAPDHHRVDTPPQRSCRAFIDESRGSTKAHRFRRRRHPNSPTRLPRRDAACRGQALIARSAWSDSDRRGSSVSARSPYRQEICESIASLA